MLKWFRNFFWYKPSIIGDMSKHRLHTGKYEDLCM